MAKSKKQLEAEKAIKAGVATPADLINADTDAKIEEMKGLMNGVDQEAAVQELEEQERLDALAAPENKVMELIELGMAQEANSGSRWSKTGELINENDDLFDPQAYDRKAMAANFYTVLDLEVITDNLPEQVVDRKGEDMILLKKSGKVKWSAWKATSRIVQNTSDIWTGIELLGYKKVFPKGVLVSRRQLLKMIEDAEGPKKKETPLETIQRCAELIGKKIVELEAGDMKSAMDIIQVMVNAHAEHDKKLAV